MQTKILLIGTIISVGALVCCAQHTNSADFRRADSVANTLRGHSIHDLRLLSRQLTNGLGTNTEKFRAIYYWVCQNIESNYDLFVENKRQREKLQNRPDELRLWNRQVHKRAFQLLMNQKSTVCSGYAYLVRELALHAGIKCQIVDGYGRTVQSNIGGKGIVNHTWNAVMLEGKWYLCDATWSGGMLDARERTFIPKFEPAYFLADPVLFASSHFPLDTTRMLLQQKPTLEEFLNGPIIYSGAFRSETTVRTPKTLSISTKKGERVLFEFVTPSRTAINDITLQIGNFKSGTKALTVDQGGTVLHKFEQVFHGRGNYTVHIMRGVDPLYTYRVSVR